VQNKSRPLIDINTSRPAGGACRQWQTGAVINMNETIFLNLLKMTVENHGCTIVDLDLENHIVNLDGPDDSVEACARAIAELVDG
jgi:hypothetical protein